MDCTVVVPTFRGGNYISNLLRSLSKQSLRNFELIFVVKPSGDGTEDVLGSLSKRLGLVSNVLTQESGNVTSALRLGVMHAKGEIVLFTDDDAILPENWIEEHINAYSRFKNLGAVSGNIENYSLSTNRVSALETSRPVVKIYRRFVRRIVDLPIELLRDYRLGVFVTKDFRVVAGRNIPEKSCLSLPCRGVNLSFRNDALNTVEFPFNMLLRRYLYWEAYLGLQIVGAGWNSIYLPNISVYHIKRESLSRTKRRGEIRFEEKIMRNMFKECLSKIRN